MIQLHYTEEPRIRVIWHRTDDGKMILDVYCAEENPTVRYNGNTLVEPPVLAAYGGGCSGGSASTGTNGSGGSGYIATSGGGGIAGGNLGGSGGCSSKESGREIYGQFKVDSTVNKVQDTGIVDHN